MNAIAWNKWTQAAGALIVLACVALFALTGNYVLLAAPFAILFALLIVANWKTAWWIFLFTIPVSIQIYFLNDTLSTTVPDEPMMWLFVLTFAVLFAARPNIMPDWWWRSPLTMILILQYLWMIVAVCASKEPFFSLKFAAAKTWFLTSYAILPILIFKTKKDFKRAFLLILIPVLATMLIIVYRHYRLAFGFLLINRAVWKLYFNRVDYATIISMVFPLLLVAYPLTRNLWKGWRVILVLIILFFLPAVYLTFARGAMVAIVFAIVMGIGIRRKFAQWIMPAYYALIAAAIIYMGHNRKFMDYRPDFEHTYTHWTFTDHLIATFRGTDMSSMERLYRWIAGVRMSADQPLTGYGPNAFYYYYKPYAISSFRTYVSRNLEGSTTHNYFLYMLVEQGWPALILYGLLIAVFFVQAQKIYHRFPKKEEFYRACTIGIAMMFAAGFINDFFSELIETHKVGGLFYLSISLMIVLDRKSREPNNLNAGS